MDTKSVPLENKNKIEMTENESQSLVAVCLGTGGIAAGGDKVFRKFEDEIKKLGLDAAVGKRVC
ncbi:MAG: (2Fe-2S) ferredoxin domain-containing protein, partial [Planctomycetes bacterium]|nr:(2Fe-2S) ferredoxin domain-containing protein [Planctomycetota bacterium]